MQYIDLGRSGIRVSRIGLGTWAIGGWMWGGTDEGSAIDTIRAAIDRGVNLVDTAPVYGFGRAEEIVGKALSTSEYRDRAVIATKAGLEWPAGKPVRNSSARRILQEADDSLRRLRTDRIDLYQIHWPDPQTRLDETAAALGRLLEQGKIRAVGLSNFSPQQVAAFRAMVPVEAVQLPYNLFEREIESASLPFARVNELTVLGYGALCRGLLTGAITSTTRFDGDDLRNRDPKFAPPLRQRYLAAVRELDDFARGRLGSTVLALAVRWVLEQGPTVALWGARRPEQLDAVNEAVNLRLDAAALRDIDQILDRHIAKPVGPDFMAPPAASTAAA